MSVAARMDELGRILGRECAGCTLCCKVMGVTELEKPRNVTCVNCSPGVGCRTYGNRPKGCADFACLWLQGAGTDDMKPDKSGCIMTVSDDNAAVVLHVDAHKPDAWRRGAMAKFVGHLLRQAVPVIIACGNARRLLTSGETSAN